MTPILSSNYYTDFLTNDVPRSWVAIGIVVVTLLVAAAFYPDRPFGVHRSPNVVTIPGSYPLVGHVKLIWRTIWRLPGRGLNVMVQYQRESGPGGMPIAFHVPGGLGGRTTLLNRPEYLQWIQKGNFGNYVKGQVFRNNLSDLLSEGGIFVADGQVWKRQRKLASNIFSVGNFRTHVQHTVQSELEQLLTLAADTSKNRAWINLPDVFFRFTLEAFGMMAFGAQLGCLPDHVQGLENSVPFAVAFDYAQGVANTRFLNPFWKVTELFSKQGRDMRHALQVIRHTCMNIIDQRFQNYDKGAGAGAQGKGGKDLLQLFMDQGVTREELLPVVLNFIIAGRDTTAQALSWAVLELHSHPQVVRKMRTEVDAVLGREGQDHQARLMKYDDLRAMPYTQAVFNEALRLHPSVAKNLKFAVESDYIRPYAQDPIGGGSEGDPYGTGAVSSAPLPNVYIQKGTTVSWSDYVMARLPEVWGADCEEFKPERFLHQDGSLKTFSPFVFHAFNAGPRLCLGQTLATYEGCAVLAALFGSYDVRLDEQQLRCNPPSPGESLTLPLENPYRVTMVERSKAC